MSDANDSRPAPVDARKRALATAINTAVAQGQRAESQSDFQAVTVKGKPVSHTLHLILTLVTVGTWGLVWIVLAIAGGEKRQIIDVDEYGNTRIQQP